MKKLEVTKYLALIILSLGLINCAQQQAGTQKASLVDQVIVNGQVVEAARPIDGPKSTAKPIDGPKSVAAEDTTPSDIDGPKSVAAEDTTPSDIDGPKSVAAEDTTPSDIDGPKSVAAEDAAASDIDGPKSIAAEEGDIDGPKSVAKEIVIRGQVEKDSKVTEVIAIVNGTEKYAFPVNKDLTFEIKLSITEKDLENNFIIDVVIGEKVETILLNKDGMEKFSF